MGSRPLLLLSLGVSLAACQPPDPPDPPPPASLNLTVGTGLGDGTPGFVPLLDGAELTLEPGAQGGFHIYVNVRLDEDGLRAVGDFPLIAREARRVATGQLVSKSQHKVKVSGAEGQFDTERSIPLFLCPTPVAIPVADEAIELEVKVTADGEGDPIIGKIRFVPRCPNTPQAEFCRRICYG